MKPVLNTAFTTFLLAAIAADARAQTLTGCVQRDPQADLAIYTMDLQGPPNGTAFTLVSLRLGPPLPVPGVHNALLIDPLLGGPLHVLPLDASGWCRDQLAVPMAIANNLPVAMQAVMVSPLNQLAFTNVAGAVPVRMAPPAPAAPRVEFNGSFSGPNYVLQILSGPPGANVTVLVNGGQTATGYLITGANGQGQITVPIPGGVQPGTGVTVLVDGVPVTSRW